MMPFMLSDTNLHLPFCISNVDIKLETAKEAQKETYDDEKTSQEKENKLSLKSKYCKEELLKNVRIESN